MQYEVNKKINGLQKMAIFEINTYCLALFQTDTRLYRAIILNKNDEKQIAFICFVDYGNCEYVQYDL